MLDEAPVAEELSTPSAEPAQLLTPEQTAKIRALMGEHDLDFALTQLEPGDEQQFQRDVKHSGWYRGFRSAFGQAPDLDDPSYDYRGAWQAGALPGQGQHWPSRGQDGKWLKSPEHPSAWMEYYMDATGRDPDDDGIDEDAFRAAVGLPARQRGMMAPDQATLEGGIGAPSVPAADMRPDGQAMNQAIPLSDILRSIQGAAGGTPPTGAEEPMPAQPEGPPPVAPEGAMTGVPEPGA